jgi:hypothetical protein
MTDVRVGTLGRITAGNEAGRVVEVVDDSRNTGGWLIFTYADLDRSPEVFDAWVESIVDVELYFDDRNWHVEWIEAVPRTCPPGSASTGELMEQSIGMPERSRRPARRRSEPWANATGWDALSRWVVHRGDDIIVQSPPMRAAGWFWVISAPLVGLYGLVSIHDTLGSRVTSAIFIVVIWSAVGWPQLRARVMLTPKGVFVRRSVRTRFVPWRDVSGFRWRQVLVSRRASRALQVERRNGRRLSARFVAVTVGRCPILAEHLQFEVDHYRARFGM